MTKPIEINTTDIYKIENEILQAKLDKALEYIKEFGKLLPIRADEMLSEINHIGNNK